MLNIKIDKFTLCNLCAPQFTLEACEALINHLNDYAPSECFSVGDICISYSEIPHSWVDEDTNIIATLNNGKVLIAN